MNEHSVLSSFYFYFYFLILNIIDRLIEWMNE